MSLAGRAVTGPPKHCCPPTEASLAVPASMHPPRITSLIKQLEVALRAQVESLTMKFGVTGPQFNLLSTIRRYPGISSAELARRVFVSPQAINQVIASLARKGLIERQESSANRRILQLRLSSAGESVMTSCDRELDQLDHRMTAQLSAARLAGLRNALESCLSELNAPTP
jgi:DNA-binding MarR family transcriptional regulator